jgi:hypothetical protein
MEFALADLVRDDFVSRRSLARLSGWAAALLFSSPDKRGIWADNVPHNPQLATTMLWPFGTSVRKQLDSGIAVEDGLFPTRTPLDNTLRAVKRHVLASRYGEQVAASSAGIIASVLRYPPNSGLVWHTDAKYYTIAFAFYIHEAWSRNGGGMLLLQDSRKPAQPAYAIAPVPNRIVIIPDWAEHSVSLVTSYEPSAPRLVISGFFVRRDRVEQLIHLQRGAGGA